jgi:general stress protein CsbA
MTYIDYMHVIAIITVPLVAMVTGWMACLVNEARKSRKQEIRDRLDELNKLD